MNKEEVKQYLRNLINSSIKKQHEFNNDEFYLDYNKQYFRALKLSKITGQPVNQNNFKEGETLFGFNAKLKTFGYYSKISDYIYENYSTSYSEQRKLLEEVINEYDEYKDYNPW